MLSILQKNKAINQQTFFSCTVLKMISKILHWFSKTDRKNIFDQQQVPQDAVYTKVAKFDTPDIKKIYSLAFNNKEILASASYNDTDNSIKLWNLQTGFWKKLDGHTKKPYSVAFNQDGILASGSRDHTIKLWDVETGECLKTMTDHKGLVYCVDFSPNNIVLASGSKDNTIKLWDIKRHLCTKTLTGHTDMVYAVAFNSDGGMLASGGRDNTLKLWNTDTGKCIKTLTGHTGTVSSVCFNKNGLLASGCADKTVRLWNTDIGECVNSLSGHTDVVSSVAFCPDSQTLASGSYDHSIRLWDCETGKCIHVLTNAEPITSVAYYHNGMLASAGLNNIFTWDHVLKRLLKHGKQSKVWPKESTSASSIFQTYSRLSNVRKKEILEWIKRSIEGSLTKLIKGVCVEMTKGSKICCVCHDPLTIFESSGCSGKMVCKLSCGHLMCVDCRQKLRTQKCPLCRANIEDQLCEFVDPEFLKEDERAGIKRPSPTE